MMESLDYVVFDPDHRGNPRYYLRLPGRKKVRIREQYRDENGKITKAFRKAYEAALKADQYEIAPTPRKKSFRWLIDQYLRSSMFRALDDSTQRMRRNILIRFSETAGDLPYKKFRRSDAKASHEKRKNTPAAADNLLKSLRQVFNYALDEDLVSENPCAEIRYRWRSTGHPTWPAEDIDKYRAFWPLGTRQRLALEILIGVGVRRSDCTLLGRQHEKNGWLKFISYKGRKRDPKVIEVPIRKHLREALDAGPTGI